MGLAFLPFLNQFAGMSFNSVFQWYTSYRFSWGSYQFGVLLVVLGIGNVLVQSFLSGAVAKRLTERGAILIGLALGASGFAMMGLGSLPIFWAGIGLCVLGGVSGPSTQALMTRRVGVDEQGQLQGALSIFIGVTGFFGPLLFGNLFAWSVGPGKGLGLPGLSILAGSALIATAFAVAIFVAKPLKPAAPPLT